MRVKERIAYVRGLITGAERFDDGPVAKRAWEELLLACDQLADAMESLERSHEETLAIVDGIDADLSDLEDEIYGDEFEVEYDGESDDELFADDDLDDDLAYVTCSHCGERVFFEVSLLSDDTVELCCPECGEALMTEPESHNRVGERDGVSHGSRT